MKKAESISLNTTKQEMCLSHNARSSQLGFSIAFRLPLYEYFANPAELVVGQLPDFFGEVLIQFARVQFGYESLYGLEAVVSHGMEPSFCQWKAEAFQDWQMLETVASQSISK